MGVHEISNNKKMKEFMDNPDNKPKPANKFAAPAFFLGIFAAVFYEFYLPAIGAIIVGALGMNKAAILANEKVQKTGKGFSVAGLVMGIVYLMTGFVAATTTII